MKKIQAIGRMNATPSQEAVVIEFDMDDFESMSRIIDFSTKKENENDGQRRIRHQRGEVERDNRQQ